MLPNGFCVNGVQMPRPYARLRIGPGCRLAQFIAVFETKMRYSGRCTGGSLPGFGNAIGELFTRRRQGRPEPHSCWKQW